MSQPKGRSPVCVRWCLSRLAGVKKKLVRSSVGGELIHFDKVVTTAVTLCPEGFTTHMTLVRLLTAVYSHVHVKIVLLGECVAA